MKNTLFHLCKGVFLAFFVIASIACDTPSVTDTPKQTEKTPDEQATPKVADIGATAEGAIVEGAYANQGIAEVNFKQDSDITDIRGGAFKDNKITQLQLPDTVEKVGKDAFKGNPLKKLTLGEKLDLTKVQKDAFATSEGTLTVVLKKPQPDGIDAEALARVFGKKTVQFEADPAISGPEKTALDTHVATLNTEGAKVPNLRTVSFYDGEALITQTHGTEGNPVAQPEPSLLPSKTGQRVENWYEAPDHSGDAFVFTTPIDADMSLYAKWGSVPTVHNIEFTSPEQIYKANEVIQVTVTFSEAVDVDTDSGTPQVVLKIGTVEREAEYKSGKSTPKTLVFEYTVQAGDTDTNGIEIEADKLDLNGGTIKDAVGNTVILTHDAVADDPQRKVNPTAYTFGFAPKEEHKQAYTKGGTYTYAVTETNKPTGDTRDIRYTPSSTKIATVDNAGTVTFVTAGTVIITATKDAADELEEVSDSYTLYITKKPADKAELVEEIKRAMNAHGDTVDLNYIDTSAITNMIWLFSSDKDSGYGLGAFNGTISKWDVREVTTMWSMFNSNTAFNQDISQWWNKLGKVTNMKNMFYGATAFNGDISKWDVSKVITMWSMFANATAFNRDISGWDVRNVTDMTSMFLRATAFIGKNLNCWADRIHAKIRNSWDEWANVMFTNSGVKPLPTWYKTTVTTPPAGCTVNPKDADRE